MVFVLLTYGGWNEAAYISAELRGGPRAILTTLVASIAILTALYVAANLALLHGLGLATLAASKSAPADLVARAFGPRAGEALALFVAVAALTSMNATMLVGARTNYAMGGDWPPLARLRGWNAARGTPTQAFVLQGALALALVGFGALEKDGFAAMVEFTAPVFWGFLTLVGVALIVLRRRDGAAARPFRVPLLSGDAARVHGRVRVPLLLERRLRGRTQRAARVAAGDGRGCRGVGRHADARARQLKPPEARCARIPHGSGDRHFFLAWSTNWSMRARMPRRMFTSSRSSPARPNRRRSRGSRRFGCAGSRKRIAVSVRRACA